jgi:hypothetical protein
VDLSDHVRLWLATHSVATAALVAASVVTFLLGLLLMPVLLARLPVDYFLRPHAPLERLGSTHPVARGVVVALKNLLGAVLLLAGILMLVLPGQGLLTMLIGLTLLNFPGKRRAELWLVRRRPVFGAISWIRRRAGRPVLKLPPP